MIFRNICPTSSYCIDIPSLGVEEVDGSVLSVWIPGHDELLQLSSKSISTPVSIQAAERLDQRAQRDGYQVVRRVCDIQIVGADFAAAILRDDEAVEWLFAYAVWPDLSLLITLTGFRTPLTLGSDWGLQSIISVRRACLPPVTIPTT